VAIPGPSLQHGGSGLFRECTGRWIPVNELSTSGSGEPWRKLADETRNLAYDMKDEISKQMMLQIADDYEHLAKRVERRAKL
jgi:hypothetical protein